MDDQKRPSTPQTATTSGSAYEIEKIAFEGPKTPDHGYAMRADYLKSPFQQDALITVFKDGQKVREFLWPAYKIWNLIAHFPDIVDGEVEGSPRGYEMAGWNPLASLCASMPNNGIVPAAAAGDE